MSKDASFAYLTFMCPHCNFTTALLDMEADWFTIDVDGYDENGVATSLVAQKVCPKCDELVILGRGLV